MEKYLSFWHPDFWGWHNGDSKPTSYQQRAKGLKYYFDSTRSLEYQLEPKGIQIIAGGKIVKEIFVFPGGRRFHFTDPSGNELAVWSVQ